MTHNEIIKSYLDCLYKAKLIIQERDYILSTYEQMIENQKIKIRKELKHKYNFQNLYSIVELFSLDSGYYYSNSLIDWGDYKLAIDFFKIEKVDAKLLIIPIFYDYSESLTNRAKLYYSSLCQLYSDLLKVTIDLFYFYNSSLNVQKVNIGYFRRETKKILASYEEFNKGKYRDHSEIFKNDACRVCYYKKDCNESLKSKNCISLLGGTNEKVVKKYNNNGIFSIEQLSYTFRPRKNVKKYYHELRALSIRENRIYAWEVPDIIESENKIFIDIEYLPAENFIYLIGLYIINKNKQNHKYYWVNTQIEFDKILVELYSFLIYDDSIIYYFGSAENKLFNELKKKNYIIPKNKCVNVLGILSGNVYFPTLSNSLKDLANHLGFKWSTNISDGLDAIIYRKLWESKKNPNVKDALIKYNRDDCLALKVLFDTLIDIKNNKESYITISSLRRESVYNWRKTDDYFEKTLNEINKLSYFTYNQNKIYIRTNNTSLKSYKQRHRNKINKIPPNEIIEVFPKICPNCKTVAKKNLRSRVSHSSRTVIDLKFMHNGIKRWVTQYNGGAVKCNKCSAVFSSKNVLHLKMYGIDLKNYCVNQHIAYNVSFNSIAESLLDFNININKIRVFEFKDEIATQCINTYNFIRDELINSNLMQIDETEIKLDKKRKGYVWVFSNMNSVFYLFREDRKADFLKDFLNNFKGVILSDFYKGYDGLPQAQQKCIVHLLRDLNSDFFYNQFDSELKQIVIEFGKLLKEIVATIDKYGLKKYYLKKHQKTVDIFYNTIMKNNFSSDLAVKYQNRFLKNREKLFTFLNFDNVPWHNNNAEYAIKSFAKHREKGNRIFTEKSIISYMILSSIEQTCRYRGYRFMDYLKNKNILQESPAPNMQYSQKGH